MFKAIANLLSRQRAKELALMNELGLAPVTTQTTAPAEDAVEVLDEETASASHR